MQALAALALEPLSLESGLPWVALAHLMVSPRRMESAPQAWALALLALAPERLMASELLFLRMASVPLEWAPIHTEWAQERTRHMASAQEHIRRMGSELHTVSALRMRVAFLLQLGVLQRQSVALLHLWAELQLPWAVSPRLWVVSQRQSAELPRHLEDR